MRVKKILEHNNNRHRVHMTKFRENRKTEMQIFEMRIKNMYAKNVCANMEWYVGLMMMAEMHTKKTSQKNSE